MKRCSFFLPVLLCAVVSALLFDSSAKAQYNYNLAIPAQNAVVQYDNSLYSYNDFYQDLAPYGKWIEDKNYGFVWSPDVEQGFRPYYTNGNWAMTNYGNTWISGYTWGWACFHYGRWTFDNYYGWLWIPGSEWGPAWVSWRSGNGYYGWAPLGPGYDPASKAGYTCPADWWVFIPPKYVYSGGYYRYWAGPHNSKEALKNSDAIDNAYENNHVTYVWGPHASQVEDATKHPVTVYKVINSNNLNTKSHLDVIRMYRPSEIKPVAMSGDQRTAPPGVIPAPQDVSKPQPVGADPAAGAAFRNMLLRTTHPDAVGAHFAEPPRAPQAGTSDNPYKWDTR